MTVLPDSESHDAVPPLRRGGRPRTTQKHENIVEVPVREPVLEPTRGALLPSPWTVNTAHPYSIRCTDDGSAE